MKPRIFIGSSKEQLSIAYAIQENLDQDAQMTVWTQGIFRLSKSSLDSLIKALDNFDFAIFVFHPDDITQIRSNEFETVRDNVIFELGIFIGRLGKDRVFYLVPHAIDKLHLPTDLLGIKPGTYDNIREDGNISASLGPFCNQVRNQIKDFVYENIDGIQDEPQFIKQIIIDRKDGWEYLLAAELLKERLNPINMSYEELESDSVLLRLKPISGHALFEWFQTTIVGMENFTNYFTSCLEDLKQSFGAPGVAGKPFEIKNAIERFVLLCQELLNLEIELYSFNPPEELVTLKTKLKGFTKIMFIDEINRLHKELKENVLDLRKGKDIGEISLILTPKFPESMNEVIEDFKKYMGLN